jgi:PTS system mannose-specific IID component
MAETVENKVTLDLNDRKKVWWRSQFLQASWNYERMQNLGWCYAMIPAMEKLYPNKDDQTAFLKRHLEFFNTHPYVAAPVWGVELALEESRANGAPVDDAAIQGVKIGMMGPLAGVGDPIFWGTLRPVLGAFCASLALTGSILGPILFFVIWNVIRMAFLWYTQEFGYQQGASITNDLSGGLLQKITMGASILGMFIMGVLIPRWTSIDLSSVVFANNDMGDALSTFPDIQTLVDSLNGVANGTTITPDMVANGLNSFQTAADNGYAIVNNAANYADAPWRLMETTTLQSVLDELLPGLMPLLLTFLCMWLLKKKVNPIAIIFGLFAVGILGALIGLW